MNCICNSSQYLNHLDHKAQREGERDDDQEHRENGEDGAADAVGVILGVVVDATPRRHHAVDLPASSFAVADLDERDSDLRLETASLLREI